MAIRLYGSTTNKIWLPQFANSSSVASSTPAATKPLSVFDRISRNESGGNYKALGPMVKNPQSMYYGDRAYGKYQIMGKNIPQWSKMALGREVSLREFIDNPKLQDAIIQDQYKRSKAQGLSDEQFAAKWFSGSTNTKSQKKDELGTTVESYVKKFSSGFEPGQVKSYPVGGYVEAGGYGASFKVDPFAKKPLLAQTNKAMTTLPDRTAQKFDVTKPQKLDRFTTERLPVQASQAIREKVGTTAFQQLDHIMPLGLGGSNENSNLRSQDLIDGKQPLLSKELELMRRAKSGEISVLQAWEEMARLKGVTLKENASKDTPKIRLSQKFYEGLQGLVANTVPLQIAARVQGGQSFTEAVVETAKRHPWSGTAEEDVADAGIVNEEYKKLLAKGVPKEKALAQARVSALPKTSRGQRSINVALGAVDAGGGISKAAKVKKPIPKSLEPLAKEARKYKSAEEFVNSQTNYYHGTKSTTPFDEFKKNPEKNQSLFSFTDNKDFAEKFGRVEKYKVDVKNTFDFRNEEHIARLEETLGDDFSVLGSRIRKGDFEAIEQGRVTTALQEAGFDSFLTKETYKGKTAVNLGVFDKNAIKTSRQLTDFYNQAVTGATAPTSQTSKAISQSGKTLESQTGQKLQSPLQAPKAPSLSPQKAQILAQDARRLSSEIDSSLANTKPGGKSQGINISNLKISPEAKKVIQETTEEMKPRVEEFVGKKLGNQEVLDLAENSSKVLRRAVDRESTLEWEKAMLRARQDLAAAAESGKVDRSFVENLLTIKTQSTDIARKLQSLSIKADPVAISSKEAILDAVLQVNKNVDEVTKAAQGVDFNDFKQASEFYRKFIKPTASEWLDLIRYNSMLSSPKTHIVNVFSNLVNTSIIAPAEKALTGSLDFLGSKLTGAPRKYFAGESGAYLKGYYSNVGNAARSFGDVMRGKTAFTNLDTRNIPLATKGAKGKIASTLSYPLKLLEGMDRFFMTLGEAAENSALTLREAKGVKVPLKEIQAQNSAAYRVFRQELFSADQGKVLGAIDEITNSIQRLRGSDNKIVATIAKFTVPFLRTPMNIFKQGIEYSPFGFSTLLGAKNTTEQLSKAILGSAVFAGAATLLSSGRLTWAEPINTEQKNDFRAAGMQPYSVKIGDRWVSYQKLPPGVAFPISFVAMLDDLAKNKEQDESFVNTALTAIAKYGEFLADQSYAKSIGDLLNAAKGGEAGITRIVSNNIQQLVPFRALTGWMARLFDESQRKVDTKASFVEQQIQQLMLQYPGLSQKVPARVDSQGNPVPANSRVLNALSPVNITKENKQFAEFLKKDFEVRKVLSEASENRSEARDAFKPKYEEIKSLVEEGKVDEAREILNSLSDEEYEAYKSLKTSDKRRENLDMETQVYDRFKEIRALVDAGNEDEARNMLNELTDEEYKAYQRLKDKLVE